MQREAVLKTHQKLISPTDTSSTWCHLYFDLIVQEKSTQDKMETEQPIVGGKTSKSQKRWRQSRSVDGSSPRLLSLQVTLGGKTAGRRIIRTHRWHSSRGQHWGRFRAPDLTETHQGAELRPRDFLVSPELQEPIWNSTGHLEFQEQEGVFTTL